MRIKQQLVVVADAYQAATGLSTSRVSKLGLRAPGKLKALRDGRDGHSSNIEDALQWFADHWPEGVAWPEGVPRPASPPPPGDPASPAAEPSA